ERGRCEISRLTAGDRNNTHRAVTRAVPRNHRPGNGENSTRSIYDQPESCMAWSGLSIAYRRWQVLPGRHLVVPAVAWRRDGRPGVIGRFQRRQRHGLDTLRSVQWFRRAGNLQLPERRLSNSIGPLPESGHAGTEPGREFENGPDLHRLLSQLRSGRLEQLAESG